MVNMSFYGPPGSGKTSAARIFMDAIGGCTIKRSSTRRANLIKRIEEFASGWDPDICFVDETQLISKRDQTALPDIIDRLSSRCRFFFAATDIKKLIPTLRSRLTEISFEIAPEDREEVQKRLMNRYENILPANGFKFDKVRLEQIVDMPTSRICVQSPIILSSSLGEQAWDGIFTTAGSAAQPSRLPGRVT